MVRHLETLPFAFTPALAVYSRADNLREPQLYILFHENSLSAEMLCFSISFLFARDVHVYRDCIVLRVYYRNEWVTKQPHRGDRVVE